ncbi:MAG: C69 family dipeptidase, partial [Desulfobacteraceae bacterium]
MKRKSACLMISAGSLLAVSFILNWLPFNLWHKTITPPAYERKFEKCTTIIVGKDISSDGSVLLAHNEDLGDNAAQHYIVEPRKQYAAGTTMTTYFGAEIPQVEETFAYTATTVFEESYVPGSITSGINENQVAVVNNLAYQRDAESPEPSRGRIMWSEYTQLALERAQSAREAVQIIGNLAYTYKNYGPGSIFGVTDTDEGWWIEITQEGQWVAQKVKDDEASMRANAYAIGVVDFNDTDSFLYSEDLVDYAVYRGWYSQGEFNFTEVYASSDSISDTSNTHRQMRVNDLLTTFTPSVTPANLMSILRDHYEGTTWDSTENYTRRSPHHTSEYTVCNLDTEVSLVCQSRSWLPAEIGGVCWRAMSAPCASAYTPWYMGMQEVPTEYQRGIQRSTSNSAYWQFR